MSQEHKCRDTGADDAGIKIEELEKRIKELELEKKIKELETEKRIKGLEREVDRLCAKEQDEIRRICDMRNLPVF